MIYNDFEGLNDEETSKKMSEMITNCENALAAMVKMGISSEVKKSLEEKISVLKFAERGFNDICNIESRAKEKFNQLCTEKAQ
jgi:hypothetical protein